MKIAAITVMLCLFLMKPQQNLSSMSFDQLQQKSKMKQFSLLVRVPISYTSEDAKAVYPDWEKLIENWKSENAYVLSFAFPGASYTVYGPDNVVTQEPVLSDSLRVVSNIVLQTESFQLAVDEAKRCPILAYGGSVEVREIPNPIVLQ